MFAWLFFFESANRLADLELIFLQFIAFLVTSLLLDLQPFKAEIFNLATSEVPVIHHLHVLVLIIGYFK